MLCSAVLCPFLYFLWAQEMGELYSTQYKREHQTINYEMQKISAKISLKHNKHEQNGDQCKWQNYKITKENKKSKVQTLMGTWKNLLILLDTFLTIQLTF